MNLLLPEVEVSTNIWSDAQSDVTDWTLSHNVRKTQMTDDENIWRLIRIRISQFLHKKTNETGVGILPRTNIRD